MGNKSLKKKIKILKELIKNPHKFRRAPIKPTRKHKDKSKYSRKDKFKKPYSS